MTDIEARAREFPGSVKRKLEFEDRERVVMHLWRTSELPEFFLGNKGTNKRLVAFADAVAREAREAALKEAAEKCLDHHFSLHARDAILALLENPQ